MLINRNQASMQTWGCHGLTWPYGCFAVPPPPPETSGAAGPGDQSVGVGEPCSLPASSLLLEWTGSPDSTSAE